MFRRWKENGRKALLTMQAAVLSGMMTICSYAETVQDANWMKEDATSGGLFTEAITKVQDVFRSGYSFAIVVAVGLFVLLFIYAGVKLSFGDTSDAKQTKQKIFRIFVGMICAFGAIFFVSLVYMAAGVAFHYKKTARCMDRNCFSEFFSAGRCDENECLCGTGRINRNGRNHRVFNRRGIVGYGFWNGRWADRVGSIRSGIQFWV